MSHAAEHPTRAQHHARRPARSVDADRVTTAQRWAIGLLAASTVLLLGYLALLVAAAWLVAAGWNAVTAGQSVTVDVLAIVADVAPSLLVGWCIGLATCAVLARGEALGARTAGATAGAIGTAAGAALLALARLF